MDQGLLQICLIIGAMFSGVFLIALGAKLVEIYRARNWLMTTGIVTESKVRARKRDTGDGSRFESEPLVAYEYEIDGKQYRGTRIDFSERITGEEVGKTLARYPVGARVQVYYDPDNREQAVLERGFPPLVYVGVAILVLCFMGSAILIPFGLTRTAEFIAPALAHPQRALMVVMLGGMGIFTALFAYAIQKQVWAAKNWSIAAGRILTAEMEEYQKWETSKGRSRLRTFFRPSVVYTFEVKGQQYISDQVSFGGQFSATSSSLFNRRIQRYPEGSNVSVYYNPQNPTESVLEPRAQGMTILLAVAFTLLLLAMASRFLS